MRIAYYTFIDNFSVSTDDSEWSAREVTIYLLILSYRYYLIDETYAWRRHMHRDSDAAGSDEVNAASGDEETDDLMESYALHSSSSPLFRSTRNLFELWSDMPGWAESIESCKW